MVQEKGTISINTENIFPIIKKFLYSDHEIFLRELVSNAVDATQKMKRLASLGHYNKELGDLRVKVAVDEKAKTITVSDNGIGMTAEEIKKYINQMAFSGATEFMEKFKEANDANEIIGRFGLGFLFCIHGGGKSGDTNTYLTRTVPNLPAGSVMAALNLRSPKATAQKEVPMLFYISMQIQKSFYRSIGSAKY